MVHRNFANSKREAKLRVIRSDLFFFAYAIRIDMLKFLFVAKDYFFKFQKKIKIYSLAYACIANRSRYIV